MGARLCEINSVEILILTLTAIQEPALYLFLFLSPILMKCYSWIELQSIHIYKSLAHILYFIWLIPLALPSGSCACAGQIKQQLPLRTGCKFVVHVKEIVSFLVRKRQPAAGSNNDQRWILVAHLQSATCWSSCLSTRIIVSIYNVDVQFMNMPKLLHTYIS